MKRSIKLFSYIYIIVIGAFCVYTCVDHKIVIGGTDGINQHYRSMLYISNLYRSIISSIFSGKIALPMYDINIGMGDDILTTLNYYGLGDPFYLLTIFANHNTMPYFFTVFFYFRLYLAGIALILLGTRLLPGKKCESYVAAAFVYCFSGFALEANCHIIFIHAMMYLPLIIWAIIGCYEGIIYSPILLVALVMFLSCSNVYFLYIISVIACIYTVSLLFVYKEHRINIFKIGLSYLAGLLCAAVILVPIVVSVVESNRRQVANSKSYIRLFYTFEEYRKLFYRFFYVTDDVRGMAAVPIIGLICILLVVITKKNKRLICWLLIGGVCYCLPIISWLMSGMGGNVYGRWEIVLTLIIALAVVEAWDNLINIQKKQLSIIWIVALLLIFVGILDNTIMERCYRNSLLGYLACCVMLTNTALFRGKYEKKIRFIVTSMVIACSLLTWKTNVINYGINSIHDDSNQISKIKFVDDKSFYRIDNVKAYTVEDNELNLSMINDYSTTTEYFSIDSPGYIYGRYNLGLGDSYLITGLDNRSVLQSLACVKYIFSEGSSGYIPPYGFVRDETLSDGDTVIYKNKYDFPLISVYSKAISKSDYSKFNPVEKQIVMVEYITYEDGKHVTKEDINEYIIENESVTDVHIESKEGGKRYYITFTCNKNKETYLYIDDYQFNGNIIVNGCIKRIWGNDVNYTNLGYYNEDTEVTVQFDSYGTIDLEKIHLIELDVVPLFEKKVAKLKENSIENGIIKNDTVTAVVESQEDAYVCLSIPYSMGWNAYVDEEKVETFVANDVFLGIKIPSGKHDVEFRYETPGIKLGFIISLISITCILSVCIIERTKNGFKGAAFY